LLIRKLSAGESDAEFITTDVDEDGYVTWKEYVGDTYGSTEYSEDEVIVLKIITKQINYHICHEKHQFSQ